MTNLDKIFNGYIRKRDGTEGWASCATCGQSFKVEDMDCGHYISRSFKSIKYDETNVHLQCKECNRQTPSPEHIKVAYKLFMIELYGVGIIEELNIKKNRYYRSSDLIDIEKAYIKKLKGM